MYKKCIKNVFSVRKMAIFLARFKKKLYLCTVISELDILRPLGNVPITTDVLKSLLKDYNNPNAKIALWMKQGYLVPMKRGLYIVSPQLTQTQPCIGLVANHLYSPSYVSLQFALREYGLIPEYVHMITNITTCHTRKFENELGLFSYHSVSRTYFAVGITSRTEGNSSYMIATPEKALLDTLCFTSQVPTSLVGLEQFLEEDLRFDMDALSQMKVSLWQACAEVSPKRTIIQNLIKLCQR